MRISTCALALFFGLLATGRAHAQAAPTPPPSAAPPAPAPPAPEPPAPEAPAPEPPAPATAATTTPPPTTTVAPVAIAGPAVDTARPAGLAFGIGFGYLLPTSLQTPNITSVRVRLASGLTFEPQLVFATTSDQVDGPGAMSSRQTEIAIASVVHYPVRVHRKVDLELLGNAGLSTRLITPAGDNNDRTITTVDVGYGVGLGYWFTPHWQLSLSASNPLVTYARTRQEMSADSVTVSSSTTIGLVFTPEVTLMLHLFD
jgi:hypothetical protein